VLEALACGTPVLTADVGGARELVDEHSGAWAPPAPADLADAALHLARRPRDRVRAAARRRAETYSWDHSVAAMLTVHAQLSSAPAAASTTLPA
jgi:alpha-1,6-mannosyltransferase